MFQEILYHEVECSLCFPASLQKSKNIMCSKIPSFLTCRRTVILWLQCATCIDSSSCNGTRLDIIDPFLQNIVVFNHDFVFAAFLSVPSFFFICTTETKTIVIITLFSFHRQLSILSENKIYSLYYSTNQTASKSLKIHLLNHRSHRRVVSVKSDYFQIKTHFKIEVQFSF